jgi:hypothetical protein
VTEYIHSTTSLQCGCSFHVFRFTIRSAVNYFFLDIPCLSCTWKRVKRMWGAK